MNFMLAFDQYERSKVELLDDPMENLLIPEGEEVTQGGIWVIEFFPPSHYAALEASLRRNGWDRDRHAAGRDDTNAEQVARARQGKGFGWSRLGQVVNPDSKYVTFGAKKETLPKEFEMVDLTAVQVGRSLTAVIAFVRLSDVGQKSLNRVWTMQHEPTLEWRGLRRPDVQGRLFAGFRSTQEERQRLHNLARQWLTSRCGGFFAGTHSGQPVIDLSLLAIFDPASQAEPRSMRDPLRALGMDRNYVYNYVSPQIPGAVLMHVDTLTRKADALRNCWGVVGSYERVAELNGRAGYGEKPYAATTLACMLDQPMRAVALHVAVLAYIDEVRGTYAVAFDKARSRHRRFRVKQLEQLRSELLTTSLDLPAVARDTATLWDDQWRHWSGVELKAEPAPGHPFPAAEGFDLIEKFGEIRAEGFAELLEDDAIYREVLTTVSSLGASAEASRLGRRALITAVVSVLVAVVTLLVANTGGETILSQLVERITQ